MEELVTEKTTRQQSLNAYKQWAPQWREHAKLHSKYKQKPIKDFDNVGVGRALLSIGNGASFEENIDTIKKYQHNVDILVCDKTLGHCLENDIMPTYCMLCDANVSYERYMEPWKDKCKDVILFANICGNPAWTEPSLWKDVYFFVNEDVLHSELEFKKISGCTNQIPAATNVSNQMIVLLTQSDNLGRKNMMGYDKILLVGYDYCWRAEGQYYSFSEKGDGKYNYMRHLYCHDVANEMAYTSQNLYFSAAWLTKYINTFKLPIVQCTKHTILALAKIEPLDEQMQYSHKPLDKIKVREIVQERVKLLEEIKGLEVKLKDIGRDHYYAFRRSA